MPWQMMLANLPLAEGEGGIDVTALTNWGAVGIIAALGIVFARGAYKRESDNADRLREDNAKLHENIQQMYADMGDRVMPALTSATAAIQQCTELLNAIQRERELALAQQASRGRGRTSD